VAEANVCVPGEQFGHRATRSDLLSGREAAVDAPISGLAALDRRSPKLDHNRPSVIAPVRRIGRVQSAAERDRTAPAAPVDPEDRAAGSYASVGDDRRSDLAPPCGVITGRVVR